jgi:pimeloyl-ACP methyl ester carboxylesterase
MSGALSLPKISTNVRFAASALLFPELAAAWAERLFLTPPPASRAAGAAAALDLIEARATLIEHRSRQIAAWRWGERDAPAVILAHGWGGYAAQMRAFVFPLLSAGYRVIAYDQPAHGVSEGRLTGLPDFADALGHIAGYYGGVVGFVGHSLGAAAGALAAAEGKARFERAVLVSPPADLVGYSRRFARWYWMPEAVRRAMQAAIEERYGVLWDDLEMSRLAHRLTAPALVIHDRDDRHVPWTQGARVAQLWPGARLMSTDGLGHNRILANEAVAHAAADFIAGRSGVASPAAPALPQPAALY